jgi:Flp pilus assembly protein TadG
VKYWDSMSKRWRVLRRFFKDCGGGTVLAFALGAPALLAAVGVASDYATMTLKKG